MTFHRILIGSGENLLQSNALIFVQLQLSGFESSWLTLKLEDEEEKTVPLTTTRAVASKLRFNSYFNGFVCYLSKVRRLNLISNEMLSKGH